MHTLQWSENIAAPFSSQTDDKETQVPKVIVGKDEISLASSQEPCYSKRNAQNENPVPERKKSKQLKLFGVRNTMTEAKKREIDNKLLKMITNDYQLLSIVENIEFKEYTKALNSEYVFPNRKVMTKILFQNNIHTLF
ncbi:unnamed protein product [Diabrotica balteata]|uniref:Uncharacterized protein n=1 Tax=Diabrotica balteata TaxID=107213 RepID=A0A9N9TD64_DIABA|nr:unnamed protein product [Diabrotica balteata]